MGINIKIGKKREILRETECEKERDFERERQRERDKERERDSRQTDRQRDELDFVTLSSIYDSVIWKSKKRILYNIELERGERGAEEEREREK